jgi:hypothetical protein
MEPLKLTLRVPKKLSTQLVPKVFLNNSSVIDKLEQSYFSKGFM